MSWENVGIMFRFISILFLERKSSFGQHTSLTRMFLIGTCIWRFQIYKLQLKPSLSWVYKSCVWIFQHWALESHQRKGAVQFIWINSFYIEFLGVFIVSASIIVFICSCYLRVASCNEKYTTFLSVVWSSGKAAVYKALSSSWSGTFVLLIG